MTIRAGIPRRLGRLSGIGGAIASYYADFTSGSAGSLGSGLAFTRASAATQRDMDGFTNNALTNELRFDGYRRVQNLLLNSQNFSGSGWVPTNASVSTGQLDPLGGNTAATITATAGSAYFGQNIGMTNGNTSVASLWIRRRSGTGTIKMAAGTTTGYQTIVPTSTWQRFSVSDTVAAATGYCFIEIVTSGDQLDIAFAQLENTTNSRNFYVPSEYVATGAYGSPYEGAFVDGVQYMPTRIGNVIQQNLNNNGNCAAWTTGGGGVTVTPLAYTDPLGGTTAARIQITTGTARAYQVSSFTPLQYLTCGIWMKSNTGANQTVNFGGVDWNGATYLQSFTVTSQWQQFKVTFEKTYTGDNRTQICYVQDTGGGNTDILVAFAQCNYGEQLSSYQNTTGTAVSNDIVESYTGTTIPSATTKGALIEETRTNYFLNSNTPVTQTISLAIGTYVCWIYGTGSMTSSAGTATATGYGTASNTGSDWYTSNTFTTLNVTVAGTVVFTLSGSVTFAQVEGSAVNTLAPTSPIVTTGSTATRAVDTLNLPISGISGYSSTQGSWQSEFLFTVMGNTPRIIGIDTGGAAHLFINSSTTVGSYTGSVILASSAATMLSTISKAAESYSATGRSVCLDGATVTSDSNVMPAASTYFTLARSIAPQNYLNGWLRKVRYYAATLTSAQLQTVTGASY